MGKVVGIPTVKLSVRIDLTEDEARALDALAGYGDDAFIEAFYEKLGKAYMRDYEQGLRSFLTSMRRELSPLFGKADAARKAFESA